MISLGKSNFENFGWFHPDDADKVEVEEGKDVYYFKCDDGSGYYKFVHQGGEIYSFDNYEVFKVANVKCGEQ